MNRCYPAFVALNASQRDLQTIATTNETMKWIGVPTPLPLVSIHWDILDRHCSKCEQGADSNGQVVLAIRRSVCPGLLF
jgi:hypothetical protein